MRNTSALPSALLIPAAILLGVVLPWFLTDFQVFQSTQILIYAVAVLGLNLLTGFNGQISLGHGAFYAICIVHASLRSWAWALRLNWRPHWRTCEPCPYHSTIEAVAQTA